MRFVHFGWIAVCAVAGFLGSQAADAQIVKCKSSSGQVTYTQGRCPDGTAPLDLPAGVAADAVGTSLRGSKPAELTGRAAELDGLSDRCPGSSAECRQYEAVERLCSAQANWQTGDCVALRRQKQHTLDSLGNLADTYKQATRVQCQRGNKKACIKDACPSELYTDATEARVRNCSRVLGYPSGDNWAQYDRQTGPGGELYQFFCLTAVTTRTEIGSEVTMRATVQVTRHIDSNRYSASELRDREFDTVDQAASAGCEAKVAAYVKKSGGRIASGATPKETAAPTPAQNAEAARMLSRFLGPRPGVMNVYALEDGRGLRDYREATDYQEGRSVTVKSAAHKPTGDNDPFRPTTAKVSYEYTLEVRGNQLIMKATPDSQLVILQAPVSEYGLRVLSPKAQPIGNPQAGYTKVDVVCTVKKPVRQKVLDTVRNTISSVCQAELGGGASQTISYLFAEDVGLVEEVFQLHQGPNVSGGEEPVRTVLIAVNKVGP